MGFDMQLGKQQNYGFWFAARYTTKLLGLICK